MKDLPTYKEFVQSKQNPTDRDLLIEDLSNIINDILNDKFDLDESILESEDIDFDSIDLKKLEQQLIDEGILGSVLGGLTGLALGKSVGKIVAKALGVEKGVLYDLLTSRLVGAAIGSSIGKRFL